MRFMRWCPTKRGSHLALSLERLRDSVQFRRSGSDCRLPSVRWRKWPAFWEAPQPRAPAPQQESSIAAKTRRYLELEHEFTDSGPVPLYRPVTIVDTGEKKILSPGRGSSG